MICKKQFLENGIQIANGQMLNATDINKSRFEYVSPLS